MSGQSSLLTFFQRNVVDKAQQAEAAAAAAATADTSERPAMDVARANDAADDKLGGKAKVPRASAAASARAAMLADARHANRKAEAQRLRYAFLAERRDAHQRAPGDEGYDPTTLFIPQSTWTQMTEFERSYWAVKREHYDCVIFFKKGKFYELFEDDAELGQRELGLKISQRGNMKLAGVPINRFGEWAKKLLVKGYKIGRVDEMESNVALAKRKRAGSATGDKGVMKRELVQILTPATLVDDALLATQYENHLLALVEWRRQADQEDERAPELQFGVCFIDCSIGKFHLAHVSDDTRRLGLHTMLLRAYPREVLHYGLSADTVKLVENTLKNVSMVHADRAAVEREPHHFRQAGGRGILRDHDGAATTASAGSSGAVASTASSSAKRSPPRALGEADAAQSALMQRLREWCKRDAPARSSLALEALQLVVSYLRFCMLDRQVIEMAEFDVLSDLSPDGAVASAGGGAASAAAAAAAAAAANTMQLDGQTVQNLELLFNATDGERQGSMLALLDRTATPFGKRLLPRWLSEPPCALDVIRERQAAVRAFVGDEVLASAVTRALRKLPDLERLMARVKAQTMTPKELLRLLNGLKDACDVWTCIGEQLADGDGDAATRGGELLRAMAAAGRAQRAPFASLFDELCRQFSFDMLRDDDVLVPNRGVDAEFDACRDAVEAVEARLVAERDAVRQHFNSADIEFAHSEKYRYMLQIPLKTLSRQTLPPAYKVLSKTKQAARCYTPAIERLLPQMDEASDEMRVAQHSTLRRQLQRVAQHAHTVAAGVETLARLDCLLALARASSQWPESCEPQFVADAESALLDIKHAWHPTLMQQLSGDCIPNDIELGTEQHKARMALLTGPNMGGKSTVCRMTCMLIILAQIGARVPARAYRASVIDRVFTRIGAQDSILSGQSTFMCELQETSTILRLATRRSFVVLDELGRGTSTHDGLAIAHAVLRQLALEQGCAGFFSTHYHQLPRDVAADARTRATVRLMHMQANVDDERKRVTFLYKLIAGVCPASHGMHVARLSGVDERVVARAERISAELATVSDFLRRCIELRQ